MGKLLCLKMQGVSAILDAFSNFRFLSLPGSTDDLSGLMNNCLQERGSNGPYFWRIGNKIGCAPPVESLMEKAAHCLDRDLPTTRAASLIAASFRT